MFCLWFHFFIQLVLNAWTWYHMERINIKHMRVFWILLYAVNTVYAICKTYFNISFIISFILFNSFLDNFLYFCIVIKILILPQNKIKTTHIQNYICTKGNRNHYQTNEKNVNENLFSFILYVLWRSISSENAPIRCVRGNFARKNDSFLKNRWRNLSLK